jgi:hypothetical protein
MSGWRAVQGSQSSQRTTMDIAEVGQKVGAQILLALPALFFLFRGVQKGLPSRKMANFGLACGLAALVMPERLFHWSVVDYPALCIFIGVTRVVLGIAGLLLVGTAFTRRADGGTGPFRLLAATVLSLLHLGVGTASLMYADIARPGSPQVYSSPDGAFQLTLSSSQWRQTREPECVIAFQHDRPGMLVKVRTVTRDQQKSDFDALAQLMIERIESVPRIRGKLEMEDGRTPSGNYYRYFSGPDQIPGGGQVYAAYSVVWSPRTGVLVEISFEGRPTMQSAAGKEAEMQAVERAARQICLSVE